MLGFELCQRIRKTLEEDTQYAYVQPDLLVSLNERREELGESLRRAPILVQIVDGKAHCWTFAGGRINQTLRYIFALLGGFKVVADNLQLRLEGDSVTYKAIDEIIERMRQPGFWTDRSVWSRVMAELPEYRLSKFQRALPADFSEEMVGRYLLDIEGTRRVVGAPAALTP
jgi:ATP-dependent Lhr-like helicase